jgi:signal transduction histidine kinase
MMTRNYAPALSPTFEESDPFGFRCVEPFTGTPEDMTRSQFEMALLDELAIARQERDSARRALARAGDARAQLIANMSHEFRTPLNAIIGYADLMLMQGSSQPRYVDSIREAGSHLLSVVESILDLASLRAGNLQLAEAEMAPHDLIASVIRVLAPIAAKASVTLVNKCSVTLPLIHADPQVMRQILINLASNAIKASPAGAAVVINATLKNSGALQFQVRDSGKGMAAETIERVMQPYQQAEQTSGFGSASTGLGLSLVRNMVEVHEGRFQLVSHVGRGTRAIFTLPAARVKHPQRAGQQTEFTFTRMPSLPGA